MLFPVLLATTYLLVNLAFVVWLAREEAHGRVPPSSVRTVAATLRYGPPLLGVIYLVTVAGDWPFFLFVAFFFALAFWMLDRLLNFPERPPPKR